MSLKRQLDIVIGLCVIALAVIFAIELGVIG